jgi:putative PIN family toxin of toxin-antitoxin system
MRVVLDANIIASGVCWRGEAWQCLVNIAHRHAVAYATNDTANEAGDIAMRMIAEMEPQHNAVNILNWYLREVHLVEPLPLGKQRSRDPSDDPYLAAALAARADFIVTYDKDLLVLKKPFGIEIIRPSQFLKLVK